MPDTVTTSLVPEETASRRDAVRAAVAWARRARARGSGGGAGPQGEVSDGAQAIMELYAQGRISEEEMVARVDRLHGDG